MAGDEQSKQVGKYIAWVLGAFLGAGGGTAVFSPIHKGVNPSEFAVLRAEHDRLRVEFDRFSQGNRYTEADGDIDRAANNSRFETHHDEITRLREAYLELSYQIKELRDKRHVN